MILKEFLTDLKLTSRFFAEANLLNSIQTFTDIALNAKSGSEPDWRSALRKKIDEINELFIAFEQNNSTILIDNTYLKSSTIGNQILNFENEISAIFEQDIITADKVITELISEIQNFKTYSDQIVSAFGTVGITIPDHEERTENLVSFEFNHDSDIVNLKELYIRSRELNVHLRSISKLDTSSPVADIEIASLSKSSPFVIKAWVTKKVALALNKIIAGILDNLKKLQELRMMEEEIRSRKLDNRSKSIEVALQKRRAELEESVIGSITTQLMARFPADSVNGRRQEISVGVEKAVEFFITQTSKGLEIKVLPSSQELSDEEKGRESIQRYEEVVIDTEKTIGLLRADTLDDIEP